MRYAKLILGLLLFVLFGHDAFTQNAVVAVAPQGRLTLTSN